MTLKNVYFYWVLILPPLAALALGIFFFHLNEIWFGALLLAYVTIYRPWTDGTRLFLCGKISSKQRWRFFIPFWTTFKRVDYFMFLYFNK